MGRFGIGARVRDDGGDEGVIVEKAKGSRFVQYDYAAYGKLWQPKDNLTALPANDNAGTPSISAEISEKAYEAVGDNSDKPWVPKVGDRVRMRKDSQWFCPDTGSVGTVVEPDGSAVGYGAIFDGDTFKWHVDASDLEPIVAPATTWAPVVGKFGKTRGGRKVGPIVVAQGRGEPWPTKTADGALWFRANGFSCPGILDGHRDEDDLVAEWVEPPVHIGYDTRFEIGEPVAVAEATTRPRKFKVGDRIVRVDNDASWAPIGFESVVEQGFTYRDKHGFGGTHIVESNWELAPEPAAPPAKFKVGDRVVALEGTCLLDVGGEYVVRGYECEGRLLVDVTLGGQPYENSYDEDWFRLTTDAPASPTIPVGATVTFTATGRLSAYTTDGHAQIVFPGLTPGQNSFALPAAFVSLAN